MSGVLNKDFVHLSNRRQHDQVIQKAGVASMPITDCSGYS